MAWIESHQTLRDHPKVTDLMTAMGWDKFSTIGRLHHFWFWVLDFAEDGDLRKHNDSRIAVAMGVDVADARRLVQAMIEARWLDREPYFRVHDWWCYIGKFLQAKYKQRPERWKLVRDKYVLPEPELFKQPDKQPLQEQDSEQTTKPNLTLPNRTTGSLVRKKDLTDAWCAAYREVHGSRYLFQGAKDGKAADVLITLGLPVDEIIGIARKAWAFKGGFNSKMAASLAGFVSRFNEIRSEVSSRPGPVDAKSKF